MQSTYSNIWDLQPAFYLEEKSTTDVFQGISRIPVTSVWVCFYEESCDCFKCVLGDEFLPPFGYCELYSQSKDIRYSYGDKYKLLCEVSQNVLYQHAFLLLWFAHLVGVAVSAIGLLYLLCTYMIRMCVLW